MERDIGDAGFFVVASVVVLEGVVEAVVDGEVEGVVEGEVAAVVVGVVLLSSGFFVVGFSSSANRDCMGGFVVAAVVVVVGVVLGEVAGVDSVALVVGLVFSGSAVVVVVVVLAVVVVVGSVVLGSVVLGSVVLGSVVLGSVVVGSLVVGSLVVGSAVVVGLVPAVVGSVSPPWSASTARSARFNATGTAAASSPFHADSNTQNREDQPFD